MAQEKSKQTSLFSDSPVPSQFAPLLDRWVVVDDCADVALLLCMLLSVLSVSASVLPDTTFIRGGGGWLRTINNTHLSYLVIFITNILLEHTITTGSSSVALNVNSVTFVHLFPNFLPKEGQYTLNGKSL